MNMIAIMRMVIVMIIARQLNMFMHVIMVVVRYDVM